MFLIFLEEVLLFICCSEPKKWPREGREMAMIKLDSGAGLLQIKHRIHREM